MKKLSKEEQEILLKEFCITNNFKYSAVCEVLYYGILGESQHNIILTHFKYWISGKLGISANSIVVDDSVDNDPLSVDNLRKLL